MTDQETRQKIIEAARVLFAEQGYEGSSVREIAGRAGVNVASLNYYFTSKENLFHEILRAGYAECAAELKGFAEKNRGDLEGTLVDLFYYFLESSHDLRSHFKMMMSSQHSHKLMTEDSEDGTYGPPGGVVVADLLRRAAPGHAEADIHWALKTLFSQVTHLALIHTCCAKNNAAIPYSSAEDHERSIRRVTRMVLTELRNPQHAPSSL
jgi:AcrR family transcriptional regulator